jgi:hypothetical protein
VIDTKYIFEVSEEDFSEKMLRQFYATEEVLKFMAEKLEQQVSCCQNLKGFLEKLDAERRYGTRNEI